MNEIKVDFFNPEKESPRFEGVWFSGRMADGKLGAYCKNKSLCLIAGGCETGGRLRDAVALGRWDGEQYSALNRVPPPFLVRIFPEAAGKSATTARNIVNRLSAYMKENEAVLFREYWMEMERYGARYVAG